MSNAEQLNKEVGYSQGKEALNTIKYPGNPEIKICVTCQSAGWSAKPASAG